MSKIIKDIIEKMSDRGYSSKEIQVFLQGVREGINIFKNYIRASKMEMTKKETDPVYVHTWNTVINGLEVLTENMIEAAFGDEDDSNT